LERSSYVSDRAPTTLELLKSTMIPSKYDFYHSVHEYFSSRNVYTLLFIINQYALSILKRSKLSFESSFHRVEENKRFDLTVVLIFFFF